MLRTLAVHFLLILSFPLSAQQPRIVSLDQLQESIASKEKGLHIINFWATWCAPCVKEMPLFEKFGKGASDVQVTLVSLDLDLDPNPDKIYKFVERKKLQSQVLILQAKDPNHYIDKIDNQWSGALPATLVIDTTTGKRAFHEGELREGDLEKLVARVK
jgi:thiol-disulfide isomerase/thioredoxin